MLRSSSLLQMHIDKSFGDVQGDVVGSFAPIISTFHAQLACPFSPGTKLVLSHNLRDIPLEPGINVAHAQVARSHWEMAGLVDMTPMRTCMDRVDKSRSGTRHPRSFHLQQLSLGLNKTGYELILERTNHACRVGDTMYTHYDRQLSPD